MAADCAGSSPESEVSLRRHVCWTLTVSKTWSCMQLSTGEEGWLANGAASSWMTDGTKGTDWAGNLELVDFATVHLCERPRLPCQCLIPVLPGSFLHLHQRSARASTFSWHPAGMLGVCWTQFMSCHV